MQLILTDIDDVVLDWYSEFKQYLIKNTNIKPPYEAHSYDLSINFNIDKHTASELVNKFNASDKFFDLKPRADAEHYLNLMSSEFKFVGITCGSSKYYDMEKGHARKALNLEKHFPGVFSDIVVLPLTADKTETLNQFFPSIWVENSLDNAIKGVECNHRTFLVDFPYNRSYTKSDITRVTNWADIYKILEKENVKD
jgi:uncharacterized HAD superfamily protein